MECEEKSVNSRDSKTGEGTKMMKMTLDKSIDKNKFFNQSNQRRNLDLPYTSDGKDFNQ